MDLTELLRQVVAEQYQRVVRGRLAHVHQIRRPVLARLEQRLELVQHQRAPPRAGPRLRHDLVEFGVRTVAGWSTGQQRAVHQEMRFTDSTHTCRT